jgi:hypothetical protein
MGIKPAQMLAETLRSKCRQALLPRAAACLGPHRADRQRADRHHGRYLRFGSPQRAALDVQVARRDLGKILDRMETVNKPKAA